MPQDPRLVERFGGVSGLQDAIIERAIIRPRVIEFIQMAQEKGFKVVIATCNSGGFAEEGVSERENGDQFVRRFLRYNGLGEEALEEIHVVAGYAGTPGFKGRGKDAHIEAANAELFGDQGAGDFRLLYDDNHLHLARAMYSRSAMPITVPSQHFDPEFWLREISLLEEGRVFSSKRRVAIIHAGENNALKAAYDHTRVLADCSGLKADSWQLVTMDQESVFCYAVYCPEIDKEALRSRLSSHFRACCVDIKVPSMNIFLARSTDRGKSSSRLSYGVEIELEAGVNRNLYSCFINHAQSIFGKKTALCCNDLDDAYYVSGFVSEDEATRNQLILEQLRDFYFYGFRFESDTKDILKVHYPCQRLDACYNKSRMSFLVAERERRELASVGDGSSSDAAATISCDSSATQLCSLGTWQRIFVRVADGSRSSGATCGPICLPPRL